MKQTRSCQSALLWLGATLLLFAPLTNAIAQPANTVSAVKQPITVTLSGAYQQFDFEGQMIRELSQPLRVSVPLNANWGFGFRAGHAAASGDALQNLQGFSDTYVAVRYSEQVGQGTLVLRLGANLPSGKRELTTGEFATSILMSQRFFGFRYPSLGSSLSLTPTVAYAFPLSDRVVFGLTTFYRINQGYKPLENMVGDYQPGNEWMLSGGIDVELSKQTTLSVDAGITLYEVDEVGGAPLFEAGMRRSSTLMVQHIYGFNVMRFVLHFQSRDKGAFMAGGAASDDAFKVQTLPNHWMVQGVFDWRMTADVMLKSTVAGRFYGESTLYDPVNVIELNTGPEFKINEKLYVFVEGGAYFGSLSGYEAGGGIQLKL